MPMLIMPSMLDHVILGMDFLCAMGTTLQIGNARLALETVVLPIAKPELPADSRESVEGVLRPIGGTRARRRCQGARRRNGAEKSDTGCAQDASEESRVPERQDGRVETGPDVLISCGGEKRETETWSVEVGSPSELAMVDMGEEEEMESPMEEAGWPEDLEPELREFLEAELALFDNLKGISHIAEHKIRLKDDKPLKQRYYPKNPAMQRVIDEQVDELIRMNATEPSHSPHSAPIVLVKKKTGDWRMCIDYRQLNAHSIPDAYPVPRINHILERLRHARFISTLDLKQGYWQIPMAADSRECTAFTVPGRGLFQWCVMPFGLHSACATFQRALDTVIGSEMEPHAFAYLDDIVVIGSTKEQHIANLREVFRRLRAANLKLNRKKCSFFRKRLVYLGHVISGEGICTDPAKVEAIQCLRAPSNCKELRQCLGMASWYRRFVPNFAALVQPMTVLLKKGRKSLGLPQTARSYASA